MILATILIPLHDNAAATFAPAHHTAFEIALATRFGGFTLLPGEHHGGWISDARLYSDRTRAYQVAVADLLLGAADIIAAAEHAADHYRQEAIFVSYLGLAAIIPARKG